MGFVIKSGEGFVAYDGRAYSRCKQKSFAKVFPTRQKAVEVARNCLCAQLKIGASVIDLDDDTEIEVHPKRKMSKNLNNNTDINALNLANTVIEFHKTISGLLDRYNILLDELPVIDRKISDVQHLIELHKDFNVPDGYAMYKVLRGLLRERRKIKDELFIIMKIKDIDIQKEYEEATKFLFTYENKKYAPRELPELFSDMY